MIYTPPLPTFGTGDLKHCFRLWLKRQSWVGLLSEIIVVDPKLLKRLMKKENYGKELSYKHPLFKSLEGFLLVQIFFDALNKLWIFF